MFTNDKVDALATTPLRPPELLIKRTRFMRSLLRSIIGLEPRSRTPKATS